MSIGVYLEHNARPRSARVTVDTIKDLHSEVAPLPPRSPDLVPSGYRLFGPMKEAIEWKAFPF